MTFKTEDHPKLLFGVDLTKTIKDISETNKFGQSLTQRYQLTLNRKMFTKTGNPFLFKNWGYQQRGKPRQNIQHICLTNKGSQSIGSTRTLLCQTISTWFLNSGKWVVHEINFLNEKSKADGISEHINNWKGLNSDKWILKTVRGAHIEIEDLDSVTFSGLSGKHC